MVSMARGCSLCACVAEEDNEEGPEAGSNGEREGGTRRNELRDRLPGVVPDDIFRLTGHEVSV